MDAVGHYNFQLTEIYRTFSEMTSQLNCNFAQIIYRWQVNKMVSISHRLKLHGHLENSGISLVVI